MMAVTACLLPDAMIILARHGNTFEANQTPVFVGVRSDLLLTATGHMQAENVAVWLAAHGHKPTRIISGPLQRTRISAGIVAAKLGGKVEIDERLAELDYGLWEGKTNEAVIAAYGGDELDAWQQRGIWPQQAGWAGTEEQVMARVNALLADCRAVPADQAWLLYTSNGVLQFIYRAVTGLRPSNASKVATGNLCVLTTGAAAQWQLQKWNVKP
jgi:broad specificity phosphatase PhoE